MKRITLSIPDDVYRDARALAAAHGTSVSALVRAYLQSLSDHDAEFARLAARQRELIGQIERFSAGDRLSRDEVHARRVENPFGR